MLNLLYRVSLFESCDGPYISLKDIDGVRK